MSWPSLLDGGLSNLTNALIGEVVFNNTTVEDLITNSNNEAWKGSHEKSLTFMMGFI